MVRVLQLPRPLGHTLLELEVEPSNLLFGPHLLGHVARNTSGVDELAVFPQDARIDQHMPDGSVLAPELGRILIQPFIPRQTIEDVVDHRAIDMKFGDVMPEVLPGGVPQQVQFRLVDPEDDSIRPDPV